MGREVTDARHVVYCVGVTRKLQASISKAEYGDDIQIADVDVAGLSDAVKLAAVVEKPIVPLHQLLTVARIVLDIRQAFVGSDFIRLTKALADSCSNPAMAPLLETYAATEIHAYLTDLESRRVRELFLCFYKCVDGLLYSSFSPLKISCRPCLVVVLRVPRGGLISARSAQRILTLLL